MAVNVFCETSFNVYRFSGLFVTTFLNLFDYMLILEFLTSLTIPMRVCNIYTDFIKLFLS